MLAADFDGRRSAELIPGYEYPSSTIVLNRKAVAAYLAATSDDIFGQTGTDMVPPLAVAAIALAGLARVTLSPPGTVHSSQEFEFRKPVAIGEALGLHARVENKLDRGDLHLLTTTFKVVDAHQDIAIAGRITVACRAAEARWWVSPDQA